VGFFVSFKSLQFQYVCFDEGDWSAYLAGLNETVTFAQEVSQIRTVFLSSLDLQLLDALKPKKQNFSMLIKATEILVLHLT